jgi:hypothetical protein
LDRLPFHVMVILGHCQPLCLLKTAQWRGPNDSHEPLPSARPVCSALRTIETPLRCPSATISRGSSEQPVHGAEDSGGVAAFHQARSLFKDHAALYPVARGDGTGERGFRDPRRAWAICAGNTPGGGVGTGGAADRGLSGQPLYGSASGRGGCGFHPAGAEMGASSFAGASDLVAAVVYAASFCAPVIP